MTDLLNTNDKTKAKFTDYTAIMAAGKIYDKIPIPFVNGENEELLRMKASHL